jgi:UDP-GlcNAc:undecaprenyl-phosphate/decaprenyl-phosphate GlcNAc-1-phosphate transferase
MSYESLMQSIGIAKPYGYGWLSVVFTFIMAWVMTQFFIPKVRTFALKVGWADLPNARRLNKEPKPNAGGLAIYAGVIAAMTLAFCWSPLLLAKFQAQIFGILLGGSILVIVGFIDDQFSLPPLFRLLVQAISALILVSCKIRIPFELFGQPYDLIFSIAITIFWIVAITNAVNLMDGLDGLAGGYSPFLPKMKKEQQLPSYWLDSAVPPWDFCGLTTILRGLLWAMREPIFSVMS